MLLCETDLGITREPKSRAEIQRDYRARKKANGLRASSGKPKNTSKWHLAQFVACDGEGQNAGPKEKFFVGKDGRTYYAAPHDYTLLAASSGEYLYRGNKKLGSFEAIDWLLDLGASAPNSIFVIFSGGYDVNHILMYGFDKAILKRIGQGDSVEFKHGDVEFSVEYRARKSLTLRRGKSWKRDKMDKFIPVWTDRIILWDVFGFFQESFIGVMQKWLGTDYKHFKLIKDMKAQRGDFEHIDHKIIQKYNDAENETLVDIMQKVHAAIKGLGLVCHRWDGAGAVAAAMFRKHEVKKYKSGENMPQDVSFAARSAYAGGRIEICKIGHHAGEVYDYDINSAYPSMMKDLPCLACGSWKNGNSKDVPNGFTLVKLRYNFDSGERFYPLFYRTKRMQISFPSDGAGWYWYPEYLAALECPGEVIVEEWWHYQTDCQHKPFSWIGEYYDTRKQWLRHATEEWQRGGEKIIKLGLNSLYGKCAQQLGGTDTQPPSYHQIEWAGFITSATRAKLYTAAASTASSIIGFATDGIFSTQALNLGLSADRQLGAWELKTPLPLGVTMAMAGVYWWHHEKTFTHFSRGFDKDQMRTPQAILAGWRAGLNQLDIPMRRLIGIGTACTSETLWKMRGRFAEGLRSIRIDGKSHKRQAIDIVKQKPHLCLVDLEPSPNVEYGYGEQDLSHPYPLVWAEGSGGQDDYESDLEITAEMEDTANI